MKFQKPQHSIVLDMITDNFKESYFRRILDKFTRKANPIRIIGDPDSQRPDMCSSIVYLYFFLCFNNSWKLVYNVTPPSPYPEVRALCAHEKGASYDLNANFKREISASAGNRTQFYCLSYPAR
jgi:hypothetical protein